MKNLVAKIIPFIALGITIFLLIAGFVILAYVLIFGALIGLILFGIRWLREKFSAKQSPQTFHEVEQKGRTIDHDDI
jgi:predicted lipid-binding transport protein (Tim44 family)